MQEAFAEAWINRDDHKVYGRRLYPFCLQHLLFLVIDHNGAYFGKDPSRDDLIKAVLICSSKPEDLQAGRHTLDGLRKKHFIYAAMYRNHDAELAKWRSYLADYDSKPEFWEAKASSEGLRAPSILSLATYLEMKTNMTESEIMNAPIGKMFWKSAAITELEGGSSSQIVTDEEAEMIKVMEDKSNG